ncbi:MAG TPA: MJ0042-type zinc finger domain-containing protein [Pseudolabrys sp.]
MLIVCPSCTTSYLIDPASVGPAGRTVRCARCKKTWFAGGPKSVPAVSEFVDSVIAEAEAQSADGYSAGSPPLPAAPPRDQAPAAETFPASPPALPRIEAIASPTMRDHELMPAPHAGPEPLAFAEAPPLVPPVAHAPLPDAANADFDSEDIDTFAARRARLKTRRQQKRRSSRWTAIVLVLFAFNVALIGARGEVVRYFPQTASLFAAVGLPVNLRNLKFDNVRITKETIDGASALVIEGTIVNTIGKPAEVPRLRFAARNASGQEVYTWTALPTRSILEPGENLEFSSRLVSPPADANDVMVRFFNANDAMAGSK